MRMLSKYILKVTLLLTATMLFAGQNVILAQEDTEYLDKDIDSLYSKVPETGIQFRLPKYFEAFRSESINGYMHKGTAASIVAFEYEGSPYVFENDTLKQENLTTQGVQLIGSEESKTYDGNPCKFYFVKFQVDNVDVIRIMFFTGSYQRTVFMQANYPLAFDSVMRKVIMESFRTVKFD